jgi:hypothetical protein
MFPFVGFQFVVGYGELPLGRANLTSVFVVEVWPFFFAIKISHCCPAHKPHFAHYHTGNCDGESLRRYHWVAACNVNLDLCL